MKNKFKLLNIFCVYLIIISCTFYTNALARESNPVILEFTGSDDIPSTRRYDQGGEKGVLELTKKEERKEPYSYTTTKSKEFKGTKTLVAEKRWDKDGNEVYSHIPSASDVEYYVDSQGYSGYIPEVDRKDTVKEGKTSDGGRYYKTTSTFYFRGTLSKTVTMTEYDTYIDATYEGNVRTEEVIEENYGVQPQSEGVNEPVNIVTGNYYATVEELTIPDVGQPVSLSRYYNSLDENIGLLGKGWRLNFQFSLSELEVNKKLRVVYPDGHAVVFNYDNTKGKYIPSKSSFDSITKQGNGSYKLTLKNRNIVGFNKSGKITSITDINGNTITIQYDSSGNLEKIIGETGKYITLEVTGGRLRKVTDQLGRTIEYRYDSNNNLKEVKTLGGGVKKYTYGNYGLTSGTDENGNVYITNEYDEFRRIKRQIDSEGNEITYTYGDAKLVNTYRITSTGTEIKYHYNDDYYITKKEYTDGSYEEYTYDQWGNRDTIRDRNGNITKYEYDERGNLLKVTYPQPFNYDISYEYDSQNNLRKVEKPGGVITTFEYDTNGNLIETNERLDASTTATTALTYDGNGRVLTITDPEGNVTAFEYNGDIGPSKVTDPVGNYIQFEYDEIGRKIKEITADGTTEFIYDNNNNLIKTINPLGHTTKMDYDLAGNLKKLILPEEYNESRDDGAGHTFHYDKLNRLIETIDPLSNINGQRYDAEGNVIKNIDKNHYNQKTKDGIGFTYEYDNGRLIKVTEPSGEKARIKYDSVGNKVKVIGVNNYNVTKDDGSGTEYTYDELNRVTQITNAKGEVVSRFVYDSNSRIIKIIDGKGYLSGNNDQDRYGTILKYNLAGWVMERRVPLKKGNGQVLYSINRYEYDKTGKVLKEKKTKEYVTETGEPSSWIEINYSYYKNGALKSVEDGIGSRIEYQYDSLGRKNQERAKLNTSLWSVTNFTYDKSGNLKSIVKELDGEDLVGEGNGTVEAKTIYDYDKNGNIVKIISPSGFVTNLEYDKLNRLVRTTEQVATNTLTVNKTKVSINSPRTLVYPGMEYDFNVLLEPDGEVNDLVLNLNYDNRLFEVVNASSTIGAMNVNAISQGVVSINGSNLGLTSDTVVASIRLRVKEYKGNGFFTVDPLSVFTDGEGESFTFTESKGIRQTSVIPDMNNDGTVKINDFTLTAKLNNIENTNSKYEEKYDFDGDNIINKNDFDYIKNWIFDNKTDVEAVAAVKSDEKTYKSNFKFKENIETKENIFVYDEVGNVIEEIDTNGNKIVYDYDNQNRLIKITDKVGNTKRIFYDAAGNIKKEVLPENYNATRDDGQGITYNYDKLDRLSSVVDPSGKTIKTYSYDVNGNISTEADGEGNSTEYHYDIGNRVLKVISPEMKHKGKANVEYTYDAMGNILTVKDGEGNTTTYVRDQWGRATSIIDGEGITTEYEYDLAGNVILSIDGEGKRTEYRYNSLNKIKSIEDPLNQIITYKYDKEGNLRQEKDRNGNTINYEYNTQGYLKGKSVQGSNEYIKYFYNKDGSLLGAANNHNVVNFTYTQNGYIDTKWRNGEKLISYGYNKDSNIKWVQDGFSGAKTNFTYDNMGRMTNVKDGENILVTYGYNNDGTLKDKTYESGIKTSYGYNKDNNITSIITTKGAETISSYAYEYYNNGYLKKETENGQSTLYNYDGIGRLTKASYSNGDVESFTYDKAGNRLTKTLKGITTNYKYDLNNRLNELIENGKTTNFTYDKNGNMLSEKTTGETPINFTYNKFNQLMEITKGNQYQKNYYEPLGLRSTTIENGYSFDYNYDRGSIISERNSSDKVTRTIRGLGLVAQKDAKNQMSFYLQNRHGDVTGIFDNTGNMVNSYSYDVFGQAKTSTEQIANRFKYSGEQQDSITGHYYLRARFYNPVIGRFTQEDSYRGDGLNLYAYVRNNPINFVDPSGHAGDPLYMEVDGGGSSYSRGSGVKSSSVKAGCSSEGYDYTGRLRYDTKPSINTPGIQGGYAYIKSRPIEEQRQMAKLSTKIAKSAVLTLAGDLYDAELIGIGYDFEDNRWISNEEKFLYLQIAFLPGSSKLTKEAGEEVLERVLHESGEEFFEKGAREAGEESLEKAIKQTGNLTFKVDNDVLKHANVGDFTYNPKTGLVSKMKGGGHGQANIDFLKNNHIEYNIVTEYNNGVRVGNVPGHKSKGKRTGIGQSWFPEKWSETDIKNAAEYVGNLPENLDIADGQTAFGIYKGVKVGVIKTNGKIGTVFPDSIQP